MSPQPSESHLVCIKAQYLPLCLFIGYSAIVDFSHCFCLYLKEYVELFSNKSNS